MGNDEEKMDSESEEQSSGLSRRGFIKAASASALAMAAISAFGCSSSSTTATTTTEESASDDAAASGDGGGQGGAPGVASTEPVDLTAAKEAAAAEGRTFGYAGCGDWLGTADEVSVAQQIDDYDVVVIGGGHAGVQATLAAAEKGAKVALCEKNSTMTFLGEDFAAWNSEFVQGAGFPKYNLGDVITEFVTRSGGRSTAEIVGSYVNNSGATLDNMISCMESVVNDTTMKSAYDQLISDTKFANEYTSGADYECEPDASFYTYDTTRNGKVIVQAMFDPEVCRSLTNGVSWSTLAVNPSCETTEAGYQTGYSALYSALAPFYENNNQCIAHNAYPKIPGTKSWATTVQFMGHFHGREGHGGVAASSIIGSVEMACMTKATQKGAKLFLGYKGYKLVQDDEGKVTGVIVYDSTAKQYIQFNCKAVVSCGGGFVQNSDMCWSLLNELMEQYERGGGLKEDFNGGGMASSADGSAIKMMCWAGGFVEPSPRGHMHLGGGPSAPWGCNCHLWLDSNCERFCNEGNITAAGTAASRKTGACYGILGGDYLTHVASCGLEHTGPNFGRPEYIMDFMYDMETGATDSEITITGMTTAERMGSKIVKASSLESLASLLGVTDTTAFVKAVNDYNELCYEVQAGTYTCDPQFGKGAEAMIPIEGDVFYGFSGTLGASSSGPSMVTLAGMITDKSLCVLDGDLAQIPGLYAAGNDLGGRYGTGYCTPAAGNSIGMACTNGRVAGQSAAAYIGL